MEFVEILLGSFLDRVLSICSVEQSVEKLFPLKIAVRNALSPVFLVFFYVLDLS